MDKLFNIIETPDEPIPQALEYLGDTPETVEEAFDLSITKWETLVEITAGGRLILDGGTQTCGLCMLSSERDSDLCYNCPIAKWTGYDVCHGTPYWDYAISFDPMEANQAARRMVEFLTELRPHYVEDTKNA